MSDSHTQNLPPRNSSDSDVVGFADQPYEEPPLQVEQPQPDPELSTTLQNHNDVDIEAARTQPPEQNTTQEIAPGVPKVHGSFNNFILGLLAVLAFALPWTSGMVFSWSALSRVALHEAPTEVIISIVASTVEVFTMLAFFFSACCWDLDIPSGKKHEGPQPFGHILFYCWIWFLCLCPIITGATVWDRASNKRYSCDNPQTPQCRVGGNFVMALGAYRVFGILGLMSLLLWIQDLLEKSILRRQARKASQAGG
ncbi:Fc.00g103620.m01.CDS01 [Cosmosporella sp. VM-42]